MFGKTRSGAEWVRERVEAGARSIVLVGRTVDDVRDTMIRGESGILAVFPPDKRPRYIPGLRRLVFHTGAEALTYTAVAPDQMRGPNPDTAWCDELAAWRYDAMWDQIQFATRSIGSGLKPRIVVTTTPRPTKLVRAILADADTVVTHGSTTDNVANVDPATVAYLLRKYGGTRLGRQELEAEILEDVEGALWSRAMIEASRVESAPEFKRVVVAIDPAVSASETSDETGIVCAGLGWDDHAYVLDDVSGKYTPDGWARRAVDLFDAREADKIVAEVNNGGDLVHQNLKTVRKNVSFKAVRASVGKRTRAEPIASLYEQKRVHHVGSHAELEDQMTTWEPVVRGDDGEGRTSKSPDRLDALVWALTELMLERRGTASGWDPYGDDRYE